MNIMPSLSYDPELDGYALDGMARALWVHAYMIWATEVEPPPVMGGDTWDEVAPDTRATRSASRKAALALSELLSEANKLGKYPLAKMFAEEDLHSAVEGEGTEADRALAFGELVAIVCLGTAEPVGALAKFQMPSFEVRLDDDGRHISWDGGWNWHGHDTPRAVLTTPSHRTNPSEGEILLLEDQPKIQASAIRTLKRIFGSPHVVVADNVGAAIANLEVHQFMLIVSDVGVLGTKSGIDFFRHVQEHYPNMVDRFVFFADREAELVDGVHYRVVSKQATPEDFKRAIRAPAPSRTKLAPPFTVSVKPSLAAQAKFFSMPIGEFARAVMDALPAIPEEIGEQWVAGATAYPRGRFGPDKVFIAAIWRHLKHDPRFQGVTLSQFKHRLVEANRESLLDLARADTLGDMNADEVSASEIRDMGSTFHFVVDKQRTTPRSRSSPEKAFVVVTPEEITRAVTEAMPSIHDESGPSGRHMGRYGDKVFIAALWRRLENDPRFRGMTIQQFKRTLLDAQRERLLNLARADLVGAMDPQEVTQSEIDVGHGDTLHFVLDQDQASDLTTQKFAGIVNAELPYILAEHNAEGKARGRMGDRKVFISALWRQLATHPLFRDMTIEEFKRRLYEAHRGRRLVLARADLVAAMDPQEVAESEYDVGGRAATFHFVVDQSVG